jgi:hypothetical protein
MAKYLTGKDGVVTIGAGPVTVKVKKWEYRPKVETKASRAAGDGAMGRTPINKDWEALVTVIFVSTATPIDLDTYLGAEVAFTLKTDGTPKIQVAGTGLVTEAFLGSPEDDDVTLDLKFECASADVADFPTTTVA